MKHTKKISWTFWDKITFKCWQTKQTKRVKLSHWNTWLFSSKTFNKFFEILIDFTFTRIYYILFVLKDYDLYVCCQACTYLVIFRMPKISRNSNI